MDIYKERSKIKKRLDEVSLESNIGDLTEDKIKYYKKDLNGYNKNKECTHATQLTNSIKFVCKYLECQNTTGTKKESKCIVCFRKIEGKPSMLLANVITKRDGDKFCESHSNKENEINLKKDNKNNNKNSDKKTLIKHNNSKTKIKEEDDLEKKIKIMNIGMDVIKDKRIDNYIQDLRIEISRLQNEIKEKEKNYIKLLNDKDNEHRKIIENKEREYQKNINEKDKIIYEKDQIFNRMIEKLQKENSKGAIRKLF